MKLRMTATLPHFPDGSQLRAGDETDRWDGAEAVRMIQAGYAVPVIEEEIETATLPLPPEKRDPLDHDGDGKRGGSVRRKPDPAPAEDAEA